MTTSTRIEFYKKLSPIDLAFETKQIQKVTRGTTATTYVGILGLDPHRGGPILMNVYTRNIILPIRLLANALFRLPSENPGMRLNSALYGVQLFARSGSVVTR